MPTLIPILQVNKDNSFIITLSGFYQGFAPLAHLNILTELGNGGHASAMGNADILSGEYLTQGPALSDLTRGNQDGVVDQLIYNILDQPTASSQTYGVGATKLFRITPTTLSSGGTPSWPVTITNMANSAGNEPGIVLLKGTLYVLYNKSSGGDISTYDLSTTFDHDWGSTTPTGAAALQKAPHPVAKKEDIFVFGNGRYAGVYTLATTTLEPTKLDFGNDAQVADVAYHANQWWIAVNYGITGTNRTQSQIFLYDGSATSSILDDETAVGLQRIGFIYVVNGIVFVAYQDLTFTGGYKIGYVSGRQLKTIGHFTGALPNFAQKTLYKNTILFVASSLIWSCGAMVEDLPFQISQIADGGHATVGALAAPFGTPMVASTDGSTNHRLAKFSGYEVTATWKSIIIPLIFGRNRGQIDEAIVLTNNLGTGARCDLQLEYNQQQDDSGTAKQITTASKRVHRFDISGKDVEDLNVYLNWANGSASNPVNIRKIIILGHLVEY